MAAERTLLALVLLGGCTVKHTLGNVDPSDDGSEFSATGTTLVVETESTGGDASISSTTVTGGEVSGSDATTGAFDPYAACGVEIDNTGPNGDWICGCELCNIEQQDLTPESRDEFLGACSCLCDAFACGGPTSASGSLGESGDGTSETTSGEGGTGDTTGVSDTGTSSGSSESG